MFKIPKEEIRDFCQRWKLTQFAIFGSAMRKDFKPESDVDVLVDFEEQTNWSLFDMVMMQDELEALFHRPVDLATRAGIESSRNYIRRKAILDSAQVIYETR